jgi:hypothetical protein
VSFDAVVIPGGGVTEQGELPPWVERRFDLALNLQPAGPFLALSGGTFHKPSPLDASGRTIFEAYAGASYLLDAGVDSNRIVTEISSYDTIGNAFFTRVQHTDVRGWRRLLIVTSEFHMPRTEAIFRWIFSLLPEAGYELTFAASADDGMPPDVRARRLAREQASLAALPEKVVRFRSLAEVHSWLYADHGAYRAESVANFRDVHPDLAQLY